MSITRPRVMAVLCLAMLTILMCAGSVSAQSKKQKKAPPKLKPAVTGKAKSSAATAKPAEDAAQKDEAKTAAPAKQDETTTPQKHPAFSSNPKVKEKKATKSSAKTTTAKAKKEERVWNPNAKKEAASTTAAAKSSEAKSAASPVTEKATAKETPVAVELKLKEKTAAAKKEVAAKKTSAAKKEVAKKEAAKKETGVAKKVEEKPKAAEKVYDAGKAKAARAEKAKADAEKAVAKTAPKKPEPKKVEPKKPARDRSEEVAEVVSKPAKNWLPAITAGKVKSDLNGKTITDVQGEELGDGLANWQFTAAQAKDVEIIGSETSGSEMTVETRLSVKKAKANFDGSYDRMRGTAKLHYARGSKGWQLKRIENVSLAHGDTNMDDPALRNALKDRAPVVAFNPPPVAPGTVNTVTRRYEQPAPPVNNTTATMPPKKSGPYPAPQTQPRSDVRSEVGGYSTEVVMSKTFSVARRQYEAVPFTVRQGGLVRGDFRVTSTDGNISAYIMSASEYQKWSATRAASINYSAAGTIGGGMNLPLNPGDYYVVFYNYSPIGTTQTVEAAVRVEYLPRN